MNAVEYVGSDSRINEDNPSPPNINNHNNKDHKDNDADSTVNHEYGSIPSNIEDYIIDDNSEKIRRMPKKVKYNEKLKGYKIRKLQKRHLRRFKNKFLDNQKSQPKQKSIEMEYFPCKHLGCFALIFFVNQDSCILLNS